MAVTNFRKRYIAFAVESSAMLSRREMIAALNELGKRHGIRFRLTVFDDNRGIILVSHKDKKRALEILNGNIRSLRLRTIKTSGTIKKAKSFL